MVYDQSLVVKSAQLDIDITEGSTGLGRATTKALHATGVRVTIPALPTEQ